MKQYITIFILCIVIILVVSMTIKAGDVHAAFKIFDYELFKEQTGSVLTELKEQFNDVAKFFAPVFSWLDKMSSSRPFNGGGRKIPEQEPRGLPPSASQATSTESEKTVADKVAPQKPPKKFFLPIAPPSDQLRTAAILEVPLHKDIHCISGSNANKPECYAAYHPIRTCEMYANPVFDRLGITYPSACWANKLGASSFSYGHSERMEQFIRDLWATPHEFSGYDYGYGNEYRSFDVPKPEVDFSFGGTYIKNKFIRATMWTDSKTGLILDYYYDSQKQEHSASFEASSPSQLRPAHGRRVNVLLAIVQFDKAYPEKMLLDAARSKALSLNEFIRKNQKVPQPIQYDITPVVVDPPPSATIFRPKPITTTERRSRVLSPDEARESRVRISEMTKIYEAAAKKSGRNDFQMFIYAPVILDPEIKDYSGESTGIFKRDIEEIPLFTIKPPVPYSETDVRAGLTAWRSLIIGPLQHEILHFLGWAGDHDPLQAYNPAFTNLQTGERNTLIPQSTCDIYDTWEELPPGLILRVGEEPSWAKVSESKNGPCLYGGFYGRPEAENRVTEIGTFLDVDGDGMYERIYYRMLVNDALVRSLGWTDIDGDGIGEIADPNPYGGAAERVIPARPNAVLTERFTFEPLGDAEFEDCLFKQIRLENGEVGLLPIQCQEFNEEIVNVYKNMKYRWLKVSKEYGLVLLPRFIAEPAL